MHFQSVSPWLASGRYSRLLVTRIYDSTLYPPLEIMQSMYFSNFVASKLNVWNSNGRHRLEEFLAKMGFSLEQCKQKYPFMSCQLRKRLRDQIEKYAQDYGLQDVFYGRLYENLVPRT